MPGGQDDTENEEFVILCSPFFRLDDWHADLCDHPRAKRARRFPQQQRQHLGRGSWRAATAGGAAAAATTTAVGGRGAGGGSGEGGETSCMQIMQIGAF